MQQSQRFDVVENDVRRRILICDDEREIADMVASLMEREGFSCTACYDPCEALDLVRTARSTWLFSIS